MIARLRIIIPFVTLPPMRKHLVFITVLLLCLGLCFASGLLKGIELLITSGVFIILWALRAVFPVYKNLSTNILLASFSVLIPLSVIDIGYHVYLNKKPNAERIESEVETIYKFIPNKVFKDEARYGDLAEMGRLTKEYPETRAITCQIDELGYRNPIGQKNKKNRIILIGDSFGFGAMTDGENIADFLRNDFGLETYNLSLPGYGPWQEHYTLRQEIDKITKADTCTVVWLLFTGNDLAGRFDSVNVADRKANWRDDFYAFRKKSPIREGLLNVFNPKALADTNVKQVVKHKNDTLLYYEPYLQQAILDSTEITKLTKFKALTDIVDKTKQLTDNKNLRLQIMLIEPKETFLTSYLGYKNCNPSGITKALCGYMDSKKLNILYPSVYICFGKLSGLYLNSDTHFTTEANKSIADDIYVWERVGVK